ncbi:MAG: hypothetical protein AB1513_06890 [Pseudomonadota bacterium]
MMLSAAQWRLLRLPVAAVLAAIGLGSAGVHYSGLALDAAQDRLTQQQRQLREARARYQKSGDEASVIMRYLRPYQEFQRLGAIGQEQRINWLDGLRNANLEAGLFGVEYQIGAQQPYAFSAAGTTGAAGGKPTLRQSQMKINFRLLHEEDLMRFFRALEQQQVGLFALNQCLLERTSTAPIGTRFQPNLRAECELSWITAQPEEGAQP